MDNKSGVVLCQLFFKCLGSWDFEKAYSAKKLFYKNYSGDGGLAVVCPKKLQTEYIEVCGTLVTLKNK